MPSTNNNPNFNTPQIFDKIIFGIFLRCAAALQFTWNPTENAFTISCANAFCVRNLPTVGQSSPSPLEHYCCWPTTTTTTRAQPTTADPVVQPPNFWRETTILQSRLTSFKLCFNKRKPPAAGLSRSVFRAAGNPAQPSPARSKATPE